MAKNVVVIGGHVNAATIIKSLKSLRFSGRIILLCGASESRGLASFCNPEVEVWRVKLNSAVDVINALRNRFGVSQEQTVVCLTNERFHPVFAELDEESTKWLSVHIGSPEHVHTILDRFKFCTYLAGNQLANVPKTIAFDEDPFEIFGDEFVVRPRYSWKNIHQREKVHIVRGRDQYERCLSDLMSRGLTDNDLCYQELLSIKDEDNVSICGWYDKSAYNLICTRKVLQHPPKTGNGDVVERINPPEGVRESALKILNALDYDGPFELEFVFDQRLKKYQVIELNPRFWMQHGLVEVTTGYALVAAYIGCAPVKPLQPEALYWVNPLYAFFRFLKFDLRGVRYARKEYATIPFSFFQAIRFAPFHVINKLLGRL